MPPRPFRIFILDNDQTTGDYRPLFYWSEWVRTSGLAAHLSRTELANKFISICEESGIFRPGLRKLLRRVAMLKAEGFIDYVVIYTNQVELQPPLLDMDGKPLNVPRLLGEMYELLAEDEGLIDQILVRPHELDESGQFIPKRYSRVFEALNINRRNWNAQSTLFFDDMDSEHIYADGVINTSRAHVHVSMYNHSLGSDILLDLCLATLSVAGPAAALGASYALLHDILLTYKINEKNDNSTGGGLGPYMKRLDIFTRY